MTVTADATATADIETAFTPPRLAERAKHLADRVDEWLHRVRLSTEGRWYERIHRDADHEIWVISWLPGQSTGFHDHGGSSGAFAVALGTLEEHDSRTPRQVTGGRSHGFGPGYIHDVRNTSDAPAVSVHIYSPPLSVMNTYDLDADGVLIPLATEQVEDW